MASVDLDGAQIALAAELLACADTGREMDPAFRLPALNFAQADAIGDLISSKRIARGERPVGFKIGFTNRTIWDRYGVHHPIWAPVYDSSVKLLDTATASLRAAGFALPRLEPEIVVCMDRTPADESPAEIARALRWVAHGIEIVVSVFPDWRFSGAESHAAQGLHGALVVGPRIAPDALGPDPAGALSSLRIELLRARPPDQGNDAWVRTDEGCGANVLDGPLQALGHLVAALHARGRSLLPGDIVTTGTLTDAHPIIAGQRWMTRLCGVPLPGLTLEVA